MAITRAQSRALAILNGPHLPPEVLHMIMENLPRYSLEVCAVVNRQFNTIATSLLWRVHNSPQATAETQDPAYRLALVKNAYHIQSCRVLSNAALDIFCPVLSSSEVVKSPPQPQQQRQRRQQSNLQQQQQSHLPVQLPNLQKLTISILNSQNNANARILTWIPSLSITSIHIWNIISPSMAIAIAHSGQLRLKDISFQANFSVPEATYFLSKLPSQVEKLSLEHVSNNREGQTSYKDNEDERPFTTNHHALRSLDLCCTCKGDAYDIFLVPFLATCSSNLKKFNGSRSFNHNLNVRRALASLGIHATAFYSHQIANEWADDEVIANNIRVSTRLEDVFLEGMRRVGPCTIASCIGLADTLTCLNLPNYAFISSTHVVQMLSCFKFLKTFRLSPHLVANGATYPPCTVFLTAAEFLSIKWATKTLKYFGCPIRVPRPEAHVPEEYRNAELTCMNEEESWAIQRQVYRHFAQQVNMLSLNLDIPVVYEKAYSPQWYSLEMTLASGLDELDTVKSLWESKIGGLNHRMKKQDYDWVYDKWGYNFHLRGELKHAKVC